MIFILKRWITGNGGKQPPNSAGESHREHKIMEGGPGAKLLLRIIKGVGIARPLRSRSLIPAAK